MCEGEREEFVRGRKVAVLAATHYILLLRTLIEWSIAATPEQCQDNGAAKPGQDAAAPGPGANLLLSHNLRQLIGSCLPSSKEGGALDLQHFSLALWAKRLLGQQLSKSTIVRTADLLLALWLWLICKASQASAATSHHRSCRQHATSNNQTAAPIACHLSSGLGLGVAIDVAVESWSVEAGAVRIRKSWQAAAINSNEQIAKGNATFSQSPSLPLPLSYSLHSPSLAQDVVVGRFMWQAAAVNAICPISQPSASRDRQAGRQGR